MIRFLPKDVMRLMCLMRCSLAIIILIAVHSGAIACEGLPDLHIEVTTEFAVVPVRNDYTLADIATLARKQSQSTGHTLLGFYTSEFGYTIQFEPEDRPDCPTRIDSIVKLLLKHRLIEIGQEAAANSCLYPAALRHYRRLAEADEQTIQRFGARAAAMLVQASPALKQVHPSDQQDLNGPLRDQIRAVMDTALAPLHAARQDTQAAMSNPSELTQLAHACSI